MMFIAIGMTSSNSICDAIDQITYALSVCLVTAEKRNYLITAGNL